MRKYKEGDRVFIKPISEETLLIAKQNYSTAGFRKIAGTWQTIYMVDETGFCVEDQGWWFLYDLIQENISPNGFKNIL